MIITLETTRYYYHNNNATIPGSSSSSDGRRNLYCSILATTQASAFEYRCDSIIDPTCMHQGLQYSIQPDKTPFILPFP